MRMQVEETISTERVAELAMGVAAKKVSKSAAIKEMFAGGMEVKEIATTLGVRYNHAYNVVNNEVIVHGLDVIKDGRAGDNSKKAQIIDLLAQGKSINDIAKELHVIYNYVWQVAKATGHTKSQMAKAPVAEEVVKEAAKQTSKKNKAKEEVKAG